MAALRLRDVPAAQIHIQKAIALDPDHAEARTLLGWIHLELRRDYAAAIEEYSRVVRLKPEWPEAYNNLGVAFRKKGGLEKALESFNRALELRADYSQAWSNRGWVYAEQKKWREAQTDFDQALKADPNDEGALYGLSQALREVRDYAGAEKALRNLIARAPNFVYWLEWGQLELIRFYWIFLLVAGAVYLRGRYRKVRRAANGGAGGEKT
jgi:tetratricopeptide (TPR) repeat protein